MPPPTHTVTLENLEAHDILQALELLHPLMLATDHSGQILWLSEGCAQLARKSDDPTSDSIAGFFTSLSESAEDLQSSESFSSLLGHYEKKASSTRTCLNLGARTEPPKRMGVTLLRILNGSAYSTTLVALHPNASGPEDFRASSRDESKSQGETRDRETEGQKETSGGVEDRATALGASLYDISHDLRTPLVSILGFAQLLNRDYGHLLDESGKRFLERIEEGARTMDALMDDALDLSRHFRKTDSGTANREP